MTFNQYLSGLCGKRIGVIGAGVSNLPLIDVLLSVDCDVTVCDKRGESEMNELAASLTERGAKLCLGDGYLDNLNFDVIYRTPGLHPLIPQLVKAKAGGAVITSEMEAFFKLCPCRIIAVTGSDGKTTTTTIISELLIAEGYTVHLGGNIGTPLFSKLPEIKAEDFAVLELSSFQLHSMKCSPDVAVITNISPNHLDVHPHMADYVEAKKMIFKNQKPGARLVLNADDIYTSELIKETDAHEIMQFSRRHPVDYGAFMQDGILCLKDDKGQKKLLFAKDIRIPGLHNVENYLAAFSATEGLVSEETCTQVAKSFGGVSHRLELVRELRGVRYYNDSIASSPSRTIAGLRSFGEKPILIAGGKDKGVSFDELGTEISQRVKALFLTGLTAKTIERAVKESQGYNESLLPVYVIEDFAETVRAAHEFAREGDIVLLSPACTSFDCFKNFAERGETFRNIVSELK